MTHDYTPTTTCKCCGQPLTIDVLLNAPDGPRAILSRREKNMLALIHPAGAKSDVIADAFFPDAHGLSLGITRLNSKLRPIGWEVWAGQKGRGYGTYRLRRVER